MTNHPKPGTQHTLHYRPESTPPTTVLYADDTVILHRPDDTGGPIVDTPEAFAALTTPPWPPDTFWIGLVRDASGNYHFATGPCNEPPTVYQRPDRWQFIVRVDVVEVVPPSPPE